MPTKKTVTVSFTAATSSNETNTLTFDPLDAIELGQGDWVEWNFQDMPSGSLLVIKFDDPAAPFGPFQCLQSKPGGTVQGKGNVGTAGTHCYTAMLLDNETAQASGTGSVQNLEQSENKSPQSVAEVVAGNIVDPPSSLMLYPGDTALWHVSDLPPGNFITLLFNSADQDPGLDPLVGPFDSLLAHRALVGENPGVMRIIGVNFKPKPEQRQYTYQFALRDSGGNVLVQHEPTIDNLGPPPVPPPVYAAKS